MTTPTTVIDSQGLTAQERQLIAAARTMTGEARAFLIRAAMGLADENPAMPARLTLVRPSAASPTSEQHPITQKYQGLAMKNTQTGQRQTSPAAPTVGTISTAPVKAGAGLPSLYRGEEYIGIALGADGIERHVILLAGDAPVASIEDAEDFVASVYGELPTYDELAHMHKQLATRFKPALYYTCEQQACDGDVGTMLFDAASPLRSARGEVRYIRVRAVRRVMVNPSIGPAIGITEHQIEAISDQLLRQYAAVIDENSDDGDRMVNAGIRLGISLMAMGVQQMLAAQGRQAGASDE